MAPRSPKQEEMGNMKIVAINLTDPHALCCHEQAFAALFPEVCSNDCGHFSEEEKSC
jgi:hypothetical protein